jgi:hypothetical protein
MAKVTKTMILIIRSHLAARWPESLSCVDSRVSEFIRILHRHQTYPAFQLGLGVWSQSGVATRTSPKI